MKQPRLSHLIVNSILGTVLLAMAITVLLDERKFVVGSDVHHAPIVRVDQETKRRKRWNKIGRQPFPVYVPVVEIPDANGVRVKMRVDTYDEADGVFKVGDRLEVVCNRSVSPECKLNTFTAKWGKSCVALLASLLCFLPLMMYLTNHQNKKANGRRLRQYRKQLKKPER